MKREAFTLFSLHQKIIGSGKQKPKQQLALMPKPKRFDEWLANMNIIR
jgi:hypothetical protein